MRGRCAVLRICCLARDNQPLTLRSAVALPSALHPSAVSSASGIICPNIQLSIAVGMSPALPLLTDPCVPDIRNCGTSGWLILVSAFGKAREILLGEAETPAAVRPTPSRVVAWALRCRPRRREPPRLSASGGRPPPYLIALHRSPRLP